MQIDTGSSTHSEPVGFWAGAIWGPFEVRWMEGPDPGSSVLLIKSLQQIENAMEFHLQRK
jgi:hypothetical protein